MGGVPIARAVGPAARFQALAAKTDRHIVAHRQPDAVTPISDPITYVTMAAARPIPSWRAPEKAMLRPVSRLTAAPTPNRATRLKPRLVSRATVPPPNRYGSTGTT